MKPTLPQTPAALRRRVTLAGVAPCANAPAVLTTRTGYRTTRQTDRNARTREAIRVDFLRKVKP